jgi:hypothetical protein
MALNPIFMRHRKCNLDHSCTSLSGCLVYLLSRIRCAYAHAAEQGRIPDDFVFPALGVKGAPQVRRKRFLSDAELAAFFKGLPQSPV